MNWSWNWQKAVLIAAAAVWVAASAITLHTDFVDIEDSTKPDKSTHLGIWYKSHDGADLGEMDTVREEIQCNKLSKAMTPVDPDDCKWFDDYWCNGLKWSSGIASGVSVALFILVIITAASQDDVFFLSKEWSMGIYGISLAIPIITLSIILAAFSGSSNNTSCKANQAIISHTLSNTYIALVVLLVTGILLSGIALALQFTHTRGVAAASFELLIGG